MSISKAKMKTMKLPITFTSSKRSLLSMLTQVIIITLMILIALMAVIKKSFTFLDSSLMSGIIANIMLSLLLGLSMK